MIDARKDALYCNMKGKIPYDQKHHIIYPLAYPSCGRKYIGKTERNLLLRMIEHGTRDT